MDNNLKEIFAFLKTSKIPNQYFRFLPSLVRGLDYYTRAIFETYVTKPKIGSIAGGGRYDNLIKLLGGPEITGTGATIGLERIVEVIKEQNLWPEALPNQTKVLVTVFSKETQKESIEMANKLRKNGIQTELYLKEDNLSKQFKYASQKKIPYVLIAGPEEIKNKKITIKEMKSGKQQALSFERIIKTIKTS